MRKQLIAQRKTLSAEQRQKAANCVFNRVTEINQFKEANQVGCYLPFNGELDTKQFIQYAWDNKIMICLPVISKQISNKSMHFVPYHPTTKLIKNRFNIPEPQSTQIIPIHHLDYVLVPLVGFDKNCNRIGMGAGYYDTTFQDKNNRPYLIGLAYAFQEIENISPEPWDVPMDIIITEKKIYKRN